MEEGRHSQRDRMSLDRREAVGGTMAAKIMAMMKIAAAMGREELPMLVIEVMTQSKAAAITTMIPEIRTLLPTLPARRISAPLLRVSSVSHEKRPILHQLNRRPRRKILERQPRTNKKLQTRRAHLMALTATGIRQPTMKAPIQALDRQFLDGAGETGRASSLQVPPDKNSQPCTPATI